MRKIYIIVFALMVLLSVTVSAMAIIAVPSGAAPEQASSVTPATHTTIPAEMIPCCFQCHNIALPVSK
jgi:hypothetical protein